MNDFIISYPEDLDIQDEDGNSLLLLSIKYNNIMAIRLILKALENIDIIEKNTNERLIKVLGLINVYSENAYDDAYDAALKLDNREIINTLRAYYNSPEIASQPIE